MKYLGRPKVCCGNCQQWFDSKPFSDGQWGKCRAVGTPTHMISISIDEKEVVPTRSEFWCCNFRLKETAVKFELTKEVELIE